VARFLADLGNSRLKWARLGADGKLAETVALPLDDATAWNSLWMQWRTAPGRAEWAISSVNPPVAERLRRLLSQDPETSIRWFCSAAEVPVPHQLEFAATAGADRALAVHAALERHQSRGPGIVIACGTAITVERVSGGGIWEGGAIAPGLTLAAQALHQHTARLPWVPPAAPERSWGASTRPAIEGGVFWGAVGAVRELVSRHSQGLAGPWVLWTGGDAAHLAPWVSGEDAVVVPHLVLEGLAGVAFSAINDGA
jgi:type III pantothenate kinase